MHSLSGMCAHTVRGPLASGGRPCLERLYFMVSSQYGCPDLTGVPFFFIFQVWKLGWSPKPGGDFGTAFPEIPVEFLQEKEVFKEFIYRINTLGSLDFSFRNGRPQGAFLPVSSRLFHKELGQDVIMCE